jgi:hypothetical protein
MREESGDSSKAHGPVSLSRTCLTSNACAIGFLEIVTRCGANPIPASTSAAQD